jgi:capsular exopolysaccharide synthesis family protein
MTTESHWPVVPSDPQAPHGGPVRLRSPSDGHSMGMPLLSPGWIRGFLRRRAWSIGLSFVLVMTVVTVVTFMLPKRYDSTASFLVEQEKSTNTDIPSLDVLQRLGQLANRETEAQLIRSRRVVGPVVERRALNVSVKTQEGVKRPQEVFASFDSSRDAVPGTYKIVLAWTGAWKIVDTQSDDTVATAPKAGPMVFANVTAGALLPAVLDEARKGELEVQIVPFDQAVSNTQAALNVAPVEREADLVKLTCSAATAEDAQELCAAVSESYTEMRAELQHQEASEAAGFLSDQASQVQGRLAAAEDSLRRYARRTQSVALGTKAEAEVQQNAAIWAQREQLVAERDALDSLTRRIESDTAAGLERYREFASFPTFIKNQNQVVPQLIGSLLDLDNRRNDLAVRRSEQDPELAALDHRIAAVENQIHDIAVGYSRALTAQIGSMEETLVKSRDVIASIPEKQVETARLQRQVSLLEDLYKFLQTRLQEAQIAQAVQLPSVRVVDQASLPFRAASPHKRVNLALGFLLAASFGLLMALWREYSDPVVRERAALEHQTGLPVLTMVPELRDPGPVISLKHATANGQSDATQLLPPWTPERALALEAFRTLSSDLSLMGRNLAEGGIQVVAVTSSTRGEGKTFTSCNLAITRASHGARTLLVDADLRGKGLSRFLKMPTQLPGLTEILESATDPLELVRTVEVGEGSSLSVIPAGAGTSHSAALLEGERFQSFIETMKSRFEFVVIDTPPLNLVTDASAVSMVVDGVVVVVRSGLTDRTGLALTLERLGRVNNNTVGIVFNVALLPTSYTRYSHVD